MRSLAIILLGLGLFSFAAAQAPSIPQPQQPVFSLPPHPSLIVNITGVEDWQASLTLDAYTVPQNHWLVITGFGATRENSNLIVTGTELFAGVETLRWSSRMSDVSSHMSEIFSTTGWVFRPGSIVRFTSNSQYGHEFDYNITGYLVPR